MAEMENFQSKGIQNFQKKWIPACGGNLHIYLYKEHYNSQKKRKFILMCDTDSSKQEKHLCT